MEQNCIKIIQSFHYRESINSLVRLQRGTSSKHGENKTDYFQGFYKRWFLTEIQTKLAKAYAQIGVFDSMPEMLDQNFYDFGRDLEFSDDNDLITWSVSVQRSKFWRGKTKDHCR